jgi:hypothetical protein
MKEYAAEFFAGVCIGLAAGLVFILVIVWTM